MGRLLLAEDNPINQKVAMAILSGANYRVDMVHDGAEAVQAAATHAYDAILMDCQMPVLNGYQATAAIRGHEGPSRHAPIIALTASARREDRERCLAAGMDSYLAKPLSKDALLALVAQSVRRPLAEAEEPSTAPRPAHDEITLNLVVFEALGLLGAPAGEEFLGQLVNQFVDETGPRLAELRQALAAGDAMAIARLAHSLLGASGQLGGQRLASSCRRLETKAEMGGLLDVHADLDEIDTDYEDLRRILTQRIIAASSPAP
jgi:two-component system sensor histidine kinase/response regulator